jgi:hypothetical protein
MTDDSNFRINELREELKKTKELYESIIAHAEQAADSDRIKISDLKKCNADLVNRVWTLHDLNFRGNQGILQIYHYCLFEFEA